MIDYRSTSSTVTLFWSKDEAFEKGSCYRILLNQDEIGRDIKTHYTVANLLPNKVYCFTVELIDESGTCRQRQTLEAKTKCIKKKIDITEAPYYAVGDGKTLNTQSIQAAINDCKEDECVYIPAGDFMTGALTLHSDMELYLEKDATLHGTSEVEDYLPKIHSRFEGIEMMCYRALLNMGELDSKSGYNCRNIVIRGKGRICGGGKELAQNVIETEKILLQEYMDSLGDKILECEKLDTIPGRARPRLINISNTQNVEISGVSIEQGASWNVHMIYSDTIITHDCTFRSEGVWNGDGWDPDSSTNCIIFGCQFYTGDDSVAIKAGKNPEGNIINRPCKHIKVFDCITHAGNGIAIGSEMSGGVEDVCIWDCDLANSVYGIEIKGTRKRGGYVKNVSVKDSSVSRILMHSVAYNDDGIAAPDIPIFEKCTFENLHIRGIQHAKEGEEIKDAIEIAGFDEPGHFVRNVKFKNIVIKDNETSRKQTISLMCCEGISMENIYCR